MERASEGANQMECCKPFIGMEFESLHHAFLFYNEYAAIVGFSVRKDKTRKSNVDGSYLFRRFCCSKEGYPRNTHTHTHSDDLQQKTPSRRSKIEMKKRAQVLQKMRLGCPAKLDLKRASNAKWVVHKFVHHHNHDCVALGDTHLLRSHRGTTHTHPHNHMPDAPQLNSLQPSVAMEFDSHHKAFLFYNAYARVLGFVVRKDKTRKSNIDGSLLFRRFCCSREGYRRKNPNNNEIKHKQPRAGAVAVAAKLQSRILPVTRVGCDAKMEVKKASQGKWIVQKFIEQHNHEFDRLGDMNILTSHQPTQGKLVDALTDKGTAQRNLNPSTSQQAFGSEKMFSSKPHSKKRMSKKKNRKLDKGDMHVIFNYFRQMQIENQSFFYAVQVDEDDQMLNCFWADERSRLDFGYFGDVIYFETNFGTSQYERQFAPIVGVNHHLQTVLLGCAMVLNESEESFTWLLETILRAMRGKRPIRVITDQDDEMQKAIDLVLPGTHHSLSLRYIFQSTVKNLRHLYNDEIAFGTDFKRCIYESQTPEEFETTWASLLDQYRIRDNEWLLNIYGKRHKWVPLYSKHIFQADMIMSQRSESIHSFFVDCSNRPLSFIDFFNQYEKALVDSREKEAYEDLKCHQVRRILKSDMPIERQAADVYTRSAFEEFHKEFCDSFNYIAVETDTSDAKRMFAVSRWGQTSNCIVNFYTCDSDIRVSCTCLYFEYMGILCRHIIKVFTTTNVMSIPDIYLKKRWTKRAKAVDISDDSNKEMQTDLEDSISIRYNHLCNLALKIAAKGAISARAFQIVKSNVVTKLREMGKDEMEDTRTSINQVDLDDIRISCPVDVIENSVSSRSLVTENNHMLSVVGQAGFYDPLHVRASGPVPKRITESLGESRHSKKLRTGFETSGDVLHSHSKRGVTGQTDPCHVGVGGPENQNRRFLNTFQNISVYECSPGPLSDDLNDTYQTSENTGFELQEAFAGLPCIQASEPTIFDLNQVGMRM